MIGLIVSMSALIVFGSSIFMILKMLENSDKART